MGFKSNSDDLCVMNKDIGGEKFTIVPHVDDLKLSFAREGEINPGLFELEDEYSKLDTQDTSVPRADHRFRDRWSRQTFGDVAH